MLRTPLWASGDLAREATPSVMALATLRVVADTVQRTLVGTISLGAVFPSIAFVTFTDAKIVALSSVRAVGCAAIRSATVCATVPRTADASEVVRAESVACVRVIDQCGVHRSYTEAGDALLLTRQIHTELG